MLNRLLIVQLSVATSPLAKVLQDVLGTIWTHTLVLEAMSQVLHTVLEATTTIHVSAHTILDDVLARMVLVQVLRTAES